MDVLTRNNIRTIGSGFRPMLLAHGFGCDQSIWRYITPAFEDAYRIILFDYVGCGGSVRSCYDAQRYSGLEGYAQDLLDICSQLYLHDITFIGHSASSMIGVLAAAREPQLFNTMIMVAPTACHVNDGNYIGGFERADLEVLLKTIGDGVNWPGTLAKMLMGNPDRPELTQELSSLFCELEPHVAQGFAAASFLSDRRALLADHRIPSLVLQCSDDVLAPVCAGEYIRDHAPDCRMVQLEASGHFPQMCAPDEMITAIWEYLEPMW